MEKTASASSSAAPKARLTEPMQRYIKRMVKPETKNDFDALVQEINADIFHNLNACCEVSPNLYVGTKEVLTTPGARDYFTHILTVTNDPVEDMIKPEISVEPKGDCINWLTLPLEDKPCQENRQEYFDIFKDFFDKFGYKWIKTAIDDPNNKVLIHCNSGKNRSASFAMAYFVRRYYEDKSVELKKAPLDDFGFAFINGGSTKFKETWEEMQQNVVLNAAFSTILEKRNGASPNSDYLPAVMEIAKSLREEHGEIDENEFELIRADTCRSLDSFLAGSGVLSRAGSSKSGSRGSLQSGTGSYSEPTFPGPETL